MTYKHFLITVLVFTAISQSCSKLDETFEGDLTQDQVAGDTANVAASLMQGVYGSLESVFSSHLVVFPLQELTTDEAIAPTRGPDWDDNGAWRALHQQKWNSFNYKIRDCFNYLNGIVFAATDMLQYKPSAQEQAEARFIRAWVMFLELDLFDQVPYRDPGESLIQPARVRQGIKALEYIISEINSIEADLPDGPTFRANKFAAKVLLMKCYLNKAVYINRTDPAFDVEEMNRVISLADEIINSNVFSFSSNYFDNFSPNNEILGKENIFTQQIGSSTPDNQLFLIWLAVFHYNQIGCCNGFATLSDFYDLFEISDKRRGMVYTSVGAPPNPGNRINAGFLIGQQYDYFSDAPLMDRQGNPLIFTREVKNIETGKNLDVTGIRPVKYFPDWPNLFNNPQNDFVYFRFSDVLLMKAEAILRGGTPTQAGPYGNSALSIVNSIRTDPARGASLLPSIDLDILLDERGRELWWEGWRRQDLIRFKKFLLPFQEKEYQSEPLFLLFPIPDDQIAVNPYLQQNPGY